eukprot:1611991-Pyramimonas_sp.AAC.2
MRQRYKVLTVHCTASVSSPSIYPAREPIAGGEAVYTNRSENQSQEGRRYIPIAVRTDRRRGGSIYQSQ